LSSDSIKRASKAIKQVVKQILREVRERKPLPVVWVLGSVIVVVFVGLLVFDSATRPYAGWFLLGIFVLGIVLALAASLEKGNRAEVWGELGRSLLVAGLLAFAVWLVGELRKPDEEKNALRITLGLQQDLRGIDLHGKDLRDFDLAGKNLSGADLEGAQLSGATLAGTKLTDANLTKADLSGADIKEAIFNRADLSGADLHGAKAALAHFYEARMVGTDLSGAELSGAKMRGVCLAGGSLVDASLPDAHLEEATLTDADLEGAQFWFDLRPAYLEDIALDGAENAQEAQWPPDFAGRVRELTAPGEADSPPIASVPRSGFASGTVRTVLDGDTILLDTPGGQLPVRLSSIDAPDLDKTGGVAAEEMLRRLVPPGSQVSFTYDEDRADKFGRQLLYLFDRDGELVNQLLVQRGAVVASSDPSENGVHNVRYAEQLAAAELWARQHGLGLWAECPSP
ncbi:MAG: pentapeptide repeat-containing protein, partial [Solirubrobacterales bacterium]